MVASSSLAVCHYTMLAIDEKKTTSIDLYQPLRNYISMTYSDLEAEKLEHDLDALTQLRSDLETKPELPPTVRRVLLINYFKALCLVETRFPISSDASQVNITFAWHDAFKSKLKSFQTNIHFEKAAVLFNLGAVYSQIGIIYDRNTVDGRMKASRAFISAAGAFAYLRDNESAKASNENSATVDLSVECAGMLEKLMLAQAQECAFANEIAKGSTPGVCAKICLQVSLYYEEGLAALSVAPLNDHFEKGWISHVQLKATLFHAEACYMYGLELHEKKEIGEEIAWLRSGINALTNAKKFAMRVPAQLLDASDKLEDNLKRNLEIAGKENDKKYLMRIPPLNYLPPLPATSMVVPRQMNEVLEASKENMFASIVPDNNAFALLTYTTEVDGITRKQAEKLQQASELTRVGLRKMGLPDAIVAIEETLRLLPDNLKEDLKAFKTNGGSSALMNETEQLKDLIRTKRESMLQKKEAAGEAQFQTKLTMTKKNARVSTLTDNEQARIKGFSSILQQAVISYDRIESYLAEAHGSMSTLDNCKIESDFSLSKSMMSLKQSLGELEILGAQGVDLEDLLKEIKKTDYILPKLMTSTGSYTKLFQQELSKYDDVCEQIAKNIVAQEKLLSQIQDFHRKHYCGVHLSLIEGSMKQDYKGTQNAVYKYKKIRNDIDDARKLADRCEAS